MHQLGIGTPGGTRTHNLLIKSQQLCQLSYGGIIKMNFDKYGHQENPMPKGKFSPLDIRQVGDHEFELLADLIYADGEGGRIVVPKGFRTDLASVPSQLWGLFPPADRYSEAAVLHDWEILQALSDKKLRAAADRRFLQTMAVLDVHALRRYPMYWAVRSFTAVYGTPLHAVAFKLKMIWEKVPRPVQIILKYASFLGIIGWFLRDWGIWGRILELVAF